MVKEEQKVSSKKDKKINSKDKKQKANNDFKIENTKNERDNVDLSKNKNDGDNKRNSKNDRRKRETSQSVVAEDKELPAVESVLQNKITDKNVDVIQNVKVVSNSEGIISGNSDVNIVEVADNNNNTNKNTNHNKTPISKKVIESVECNCPCAPKNHVEVPATCEKTVVSSSVYLNGEHCIDEKLGPA